MIEAVKTWFAGQTRGLGKSPPTMMSIRPILIRRPRPQRKSSIDDSESAAPLIETLLRASINPENIMLERPTGSSLGLGIYLSGPREPTNGIQQKGYHEDANFPHGKKVEALSKRI
jgi:hypothetical protein